MGRTVKAFLIAPLWVPLALLILAAFAPERELVSAIAAVSGVITYAATLIFGYPAFMLMWRYKRTGPGIAAVIGFFIGILSSYAFMICIGLFLVDAKGGNVDKAFQHMISNVLNAQISLNDLPILLGSGLVGVPIGLTLWLIVRPDRRALQ